MILFVVNTNSGGFDLRCDQQHYAIIFLNYYLIAMITIKTNQTNQTNQSINQYIHKLYNL